MTHVLVMALPLVGGLILGWLAWSRRWAPPLAVALAAGAALRVVVMAIAVQDPWQPWDLAEDFRSTADTVLDGRDPLSYLRQGGWHFLPLLAYLLAGLRWVGELFGIPWNVIARVVPVLADLALIPLVARLTEDRSPDRREPSDRREASGRWSLSGRWGLSDRQRLHAFLYACAPPVLMVSALHGQFPPITLAAGVGALLAARSGRVHVAGLLLGLAATTANWAALLLPGVLLALPGVRARITVVVWTGAVPLLSLLSSPVLLDTPWNRLVDAFKLAMSTRPVIGDWGWTVLLTGGRQEVRPGFGSIGLPILALATLAALWWWRRADPVRLTLALLLVFQIVTFRFGSQYLAWAVPYLLVLCGRGAMPFVTAGSLWAGFGYLYMTRLDHFTWRDTHVWWAFASLPVIALMIYALPSRERPAGTGTSADAGGTREEAAARAPSA